MGLHDLPTHSGMESSVAAVRSWFETLSPTYRAALRRLKLAIASWSHQADRLRVSFTSAYVFHQPAGSCEEITAAFHFLGLTDGALKCWTVPQAESLAVACEVWRSRHPK